MVTRPHLPGEGAQVRSPRTTTEPDYPIQALDFVLAGGERQTVFLGGDCRTFWLYGGDSLFNAAPAIITVAVGRTGTPFRIIRGMGFQSSSGFKELTFQNTDIVSHRLVVLYSADPRLTFFHHNTNHVVPV